MGLGLRMQIVAALSAAFAVAFGALGVATVRITDRLRENDRVRDARASARFVAARVDEAFDSPAGTDPGGAYGRFVELADDAIRSGIAAGVVFERGSLEPWVRGVTGHGTEIDARVGTRGTLRLFLAPVGDGGLPKIAEALLLYVALTGGGILLLAYTAMTALIVRPVESIRRAAERMAEGQLHVEVPVRGAAEVAALSVAFNRMARQLRADRESLEERLDQLERTTKELEEAHDRLVRSARLASIGRLSAGVAHEIGNPLAAILGLVELAKSGDIEPAERDELLGRIERETQRIHRIIRDLLDFARAAPIDESPIDVDPSEIVEDALRLVGPQKDLRGVTIDKAIAADVGKVRAVADRLVQVVLNLLLNAIDAVSGKGTIRVVLRNDGGDVSLVVEDSGPGIAAEVLDQIFEPFVTTKPAGKGTGLGLAVCHTIVERLGGRIEASNRPEGGARLEVRLPRA